MRIVRWLAASTILLGTVAVVVMMINISRTYRTPQGVEPAKLTDWMQAWGSIITVVASLAAAAFTALLLLHEMREARAARRDAAQERAQAADDRAEILRDRDDDVRAQRRPATTRSPATSASGPTTGRPSASPERTATCRRPTPGAGTLRSAVEKPLPGGSDLLIVDHEPTNTNEGERP